MTFPFTSRVLFASALALAPLSAWAQQAPPAANPVAPPVPAPAAKPEPRIDAEAKKLVQQMVAAHQALTSFSATISATAPVRGSDKTQAVTGTLLYAKPNKVVAKSQIAEPAQSAQVTSDGKYIYLATSADAKTYRRVAAEPTPVTIAQAVSAAGVNPTQLLAFIIADPSAADKVISPNSEVVEFGPDETLDGVPVRVVRSSYTQTSTVPVSIAFALAIGKADNLLRRIIITITQNDKASTVTETYSNVQANPQTTDDSFKFTPAPGTTLKEPPKTTQAEPAETGPAFDPRLKVGAAPLPLKGIDTKGQPVSLAAYKGKVVLIDFWATWCPPCREEVPNVVAAYKKYHARGFEVVGVSLDQKDDGAKLASFAKTNQMAWRQVHDKNSTIASGYAVKFIPFAFLIGRDGKIAAVNVRGTDLDKAVAAALKK